jgi:PAS domain S-box-containing protein
LSYKDQEFTLYRSGSAKKVWLNLDYSPVLEEDGRPAGVLAFVVETTERVQAERKLVADGERLREMFRQAPGFMAMVRSPEHIFEIVNESYLQLIGHRTDLIGKTVREALPEVEGQGFFELLDTVYQSGEAFRGDAVPIMLQRQANGPTEKRFVDFIYQPIRTDGGQVTGIFAEGYDVTERVKAEVALRSSEERFRKALEISTVGVLFFHIGGRITAANDAFLYMTGYTRDDLESGAMCWTQMTPTEYMPASAKCLEELTTRGHSTPYEKEYIRKDGSRVWFLFAARMLNKSEAVEFAIDISSRKFAEDQQKLLARELNHRVKNLFAVASGMVSLSARNARTPQDMAASLQARLNALARASDIIQPKGASLVEDAEHVSSIERLVRAILLPYVENGPHGSNDRISINGPEVELGPNAITALALFLHETATNASKYGALAWVEGRLSVEWLITDGSLRLTWLETDGPPVKGPPAAVGFGSVLAKRSVEGTLGGTTSYHWERGGLRLEAVLPVERLRS